MKIKPFITCLALLFTIVSCSSPVPKEKTTEIAMEAAPVISSEATQSVLDHHLNAVGENDMQAILEDYSNESIIITPDSTYRGLDQIGSFFEAVLPDFPTEGTELEMDRMFVEDDIAYILWHATTPSLEVSFGTDTFIIENGKIKQQTFAAVMNPI